MDRLQIENSDIMETDKSGKLSMPMREKGEVVTIVGPTGSGKSRLLADIEWMAQRTPTSRQILINDSVPPRWRFSIEPTWPNYLNMICDGCCVEEFIKLHA